MSGLAELKPLSEEERALYDILKPKAEAITLDEEETKLFYPLNRRQNMIDSHLAAKFLDTLDQPDISKSEYADKLITAIENEPDIDNKYNLIRAAISGKFPRSNEHGYTLGGTLFSHMPSADRKAAFLRILDMPELQKLLPKVIGLAIHEGDPLAKRFFGLLDPRDIDCHKLIVKTLEKLPIEERSKYAAKILTRDFVLRVNPELLGSLFKSVFSTLKPKGEISDAHARDFFEYLTLPQSDKSDCGIIDDLHFMHLSAEQSNAENRQNREFLAKVFVGLASVLNPDGKPILTRVYSNTLRYDEEEAEARTASMNTIATTESDYWRHANDFIVITDRLSFIFNDEAQAVQMITADGELFVDTSDILNYAISQGQDFIDHAYDTLVKAREMELEATGKDSYGIEDEEAQQNTQEAYQELKEALGRKVTRGHVNQNIAFDYIR